MVTENRLDRPCVYVALFASELAFLVFWFVLQELGVI